MPCFSNIKTKLTDGNRIAEALKGLGFAVDRDGTSKVISGDKDGRRITFIKAGAAYYASGDTSELVGVSRAYAEIGVRAWAKARGYAVTEKAGQRITLVNRRG